MTAVDDQPTTSTASATAAGWESINLTVVGMSCASCSGRVEKKLNAMDGVSASVNFATATAYVEHSPNVAIDTIIAEVASSGYRVFDQAQPPADAVQNAHDSKEDDLRYRTLLCATLAVPVLIMCMFPIFQVVGWQWAAFALATPVALWGAWPFHRAAILNLRHRASTMDTLVSAGVMAAWAWSTWALFFGGAGGSDYHMPMQWLVRVGHAHGGHTYFEVAAVLPVFILAGRWAESRAKHSGGDALRALMKLGAKTALLMDGAKKATGVGGREVSIDVESLRLGDIVKVLPGEFIPIDGTVMNGASSVDESMLTGESTPVSVTEGRAVIGGTLNIDGVLTMRVDRVGSDTRLAQIQTMVTAAQSGKARVQHLADRVAEWFVPTVLVLAALTAAGWFVATGALSLAVCAGVTVLVVACPCALGLATPTALLVGTGRGAQLGALIRGPQILEDTRRVDVIALDKTGTLTLGVTHVVEQSIAPAFDTKQVLRACGAAEATSTHPLAQVLARHCLSSHDNDAQPEALSPKNFPGQGVRAYVDDHIVLVGRLGWLHDELGHVGPTPEWLERHVHSAHANGWSLVIVAIDGRFAGAFSLSDTVNPSARAAISELRRLGVQPIMLTGDHLPSALAVAAQVGIPESDVHADLSPEDKLNFVSARQRNGSVVAMVGDGINDAAALALSDLGVSMSTGADAAINASDVTVVGGDLGTVPKAIGLARATLNTIKGNLWWAFGYNVVMIPLAIAGYLSPLLAGAAMAASSTIVVTNSLRLRRFN